MEINTPTTSATTSSYYDINVKAAPYSATGNGVTDDSVAIQAAANAALAAGERLFFPVGTYLLGTQITVTGSTGTGQRLLVHGSGDVTLKMGVSFSGGVQTSGKALIAASGVDTVIIEGITFNGNRANLSPAATGHPPYLGGIKVTTAVTRTIVRDCTFTAFLGDAVDIVTSTNSDIAGNTFSDIWGSSVYMNTCTDYVVRDNRCYGIGTGTSGTNTAIGSTQLLDGAGTRGTFQHNIIYNSPDTASKSDGGTQMSWIGNIIKNFGKDGIKMLATSLTVGPIIYDGLIADNIILTPTDGRSDGGRCIEMNFVTRGIISGNTCLGGTKATYYDAGITLLNGCVDIEICNNVLSYFVDFGIELTCVTATPVINDRIKIHHNKCGATCQALDQGDIEFSDNEIIGPSPTGVTTDGLLIRRCNKVTLNRNRVESFNRGVWVEPDSATTQIEIRGNRFATFNDMVIFIRNQTTVASTPEKIDISDNEFRGNGTVSSTAICKLSNKDTTFTDCFFQRNKIYSGVASSAILQFSDEMAGANKITRANTYDNENIAGLTMLSGTSMVTTLKQDSTFIRDHSGFDGVIGYSGVQTGQFVSLVVQNNVTNPLYQMDITATEITVVTAAGLSRKLSSVSLTVDLTVSGANGLDTGAESANATYFLYVIYNPTTATTAGLMSTNSNPASGVTLPSGYTYYALAGACRNVTSDLRAQIQQGRVVYAAESTFVSALAATAANTLQSAAISHLVPAGAKLCWGNMGTTSTTVIPRMAVAADSLGKSIFYFSPNCVGDTAMNSFTAVTPFGPMPVDPALALYWRAQDNSNAVNRLTLTGYSW